MGRFHGDLPDRTYQFARQIMRLADHLPHEPRGWVVSKQVLRCGTSVGANTQEADVALTEREFASVCNVARKEAHETHYWLRLARDERLVSPIHVEPVVTEAAELVSILSSIVKKVRQNLGDDAR